MVAMEPRKIIFQNIPMFLKMSDNKNHLEAEI